MRFSTKHAFLLGSIAAISACSLFKNDDPAEFIATSKNAKGEITANFSPINTVDASYQLLDAGKNDETAHLTVFENEKGDRIVQAGKSLAHRLFASPYEGDHKTYFYQPKNLEKGDQHPAFKIEAAGEISHAAKPLFDFGTDKDSLYYPNTYDLANGNTMKVFEDHIDVHNQTTHNVFQRKLFTQPDGALYHLNTTQNHLDYAVVRAPEKTKTGEDKDRIILITAPSYSKDDYYDQYKAYTVGPHGITPHGRLYRASVMRDGGSFVGIFFEQNKTTLRLDTLDVRVPIQSEESVTVNGQKAEKLPSTTAAGLVEKFRGQMAIPGSAQRIRVEPQVE